MTYSEKLRDPRWQKKRLEVLSRAEFCCSNCMASDKELHVHHGYYDRGCEPWEYPDETLHALCVDCHEEATVLMRKLKLALAELGTIALSQALGYVNALNYNNQIIETTSFEDAVGIADFYGVRVFDLIEVCDGNTVERDRIRAIMSPLAATLDGYEDRRQSPAEPSNAVPEGQGGPPRP